MGQFRRIHELVRRQIADGTLPAGARVPSTRALAAELGVSRTTVTAAYEQLAAEGFIVTAAGRVARVAERLQRQNIVAPPARPARGDRTDHTPHKDRKDGEGGRRASNEEGRGDGSGSSSDTSTSAHRGAAGPVAAAGLSAFGRRVEKTMLSALPSASAEAPPAIDFLYGAVAARDFPTLAWRRAYLAALRSPQPRLYYAPPEGEESLRRALAGYLARARGLVCEAERIVVVHGSQQAIDLCARVLLDAGDAFVFEDPGYLMARRCFEATGAKRICVPVDAHGLDTDRLPTAAASSRPTRPGQATPKVRLVYTTPSHQFPLGGTLPIARRQALLHWARRQRAWIVEDDYDGEFRYGQRPIDALQSIDDGGHAGRDGRVIYVGTFSKALSPQLRLGYLVLPAALVSAFRQAKRLTDRHAPLVEQQALATLIASGAYERHVRRIRRDNERRRAALLAAIERHLPAGTRVEGTAAGLHVVLWLPPLGARDEPALIDAARRRGVGVYGISGLYADLRAGAPRPAGLVIGYASLSAEQIDEGIRRLGEALRLLGTPGAPRPSCASRPTRRARTSPSPSPRS